MMRIVEESRIVRVSEMYEDESKYENCLGHARAKQVCEGRFGRSRMPRCTRDVSVYESSSDRECRVEPSVGYEGNFG